MPFVFNLHIAIGNEIGIIFSDTEYLLAYFIKLIGFFSFCLFDELILSNEHEPTMGASLRLGSEKNGVYSIGYGKRKTPK